MSTPTGPITPDPDTGDFSATGGLTLGLVGGQASLLRIAGTAMGDADNLILDGEFRSLIGNISKPLFTGSVDFLLSGTPPRAGLPREETVIDRRSGTDEFAVAGFDVQFKTIKVAGNQITAGITFETNDLAGSAGSFFEGIAPGAGVPIFDSGPGGLIIDASGARFRPGVTWTQVGSREFTIFGSIDARIRESQISYDGVKDELKINTKLDIDSPFRTRSAPGGAATLMAPRNYSLTVDFAEEPSLLGAKRGIVFNSDGVSALGQVSFAEPLDLIFLKLEKATFGFSRLNGVTEIVAGVDILLPRAKAAIVDSGDLGVQAQIKFLTSPFQMNGLTVGGSNLNIPLGTAPLWLDSVRIGIDNIASRDPDSLRVTGEAGFSYLGQENVFNLVGAFGIDASSLTVEGRFTVGPSINSSLLGIIDGRILSGLVDLQYDWTKSYISLDGNVSLAGLVTVALNARALYSPQFVLEFGGSLTAGLPASVPYIGGSSTGVVYRARTIIDGDDSNDSVAFYATFRAPGLNLSFNVALKVFADGDVDVTGDTPDNATSRISGSAATLAATSGDGTLTFETPSGQAYALLVVAAPTAAAAVPSITRPDGTTVVAADFLANGIEIVDPSPGDGQYFIVIAAPAAGTWSVAGDSGTTIGVDFPDAQPVVNDFNVANLGNNLNRITLNVADDRGAVSVRLFVDEDGDGFDGTFLTEITQASGLLTYDWSGATREAGSYRIYAVVDDDRTAPVELYAAGTAIVGDAADLAVTTIVTQTADGLSLTIDAANTSAFATAASLLVTAPEGFTFGTIGLPAGITAEGATIDLGTMAANSMTRVTVALLGTAAASATLRGSTEIRSDRPDSDIEDNINIWRFEVPAATIAISNLAYETTALRGSSVTQPDRQPQGDRHGDFVGRHRRNHLDATGRPRFNPGERPRRGRSRPGQRQFAFLRHRRRQWPQQAYRLYGRRADRRPVRQRHDRGGRRQ
ncbi:hypothetical protein IP88_01310 [alpha proteobacterium AAP81b]|nr:hypothetical protein IP88_01310 [alpha proteobacterium AAP81b]